MHRAEGANSARETNQRAVDQAAGPSERAGAASQAVGSKCLTVASDSVVMCGLLGEVLFAAAAEGAGAGRAGAREEGAGRNRREDQRELVI